MAKTVTIKTRFQQRQCSAATWTATNPVLLAGEWGYEKDTRLFKVGDGVTAWNALPYASYTLPAASASALGGILATVKGSDDTVEVKIDASTHKLFVPTYPSGTSEPIETITNFNTAPINKLFYAEGASDGPPTDGVSTKMLGITIGNPASPTTFVQLAVPTYQSAPWSCGPLFMRSSTSSGPDRWTGWYCVGGAEPNSVANLIKSFTSFFGGNNTYKSYTSGSKSQIYGLISINLLDYSSLIPVGSWRLISAKGFVRFSSASGEDLSLSLPYGEFDYGSSTFKAKLRDKNNITYLDINTPTGTSYTVNYKVVLEYGKI